MLASSKEFIELTNQQRDNSNFAFVFKQQLIQTWHPKINTKCAVTFYVIIAGLFIALGVAIFATSADLYSNSYRYDQTCAEIGTVCTINFLLPRTVIGPIYIYYSISGFFQNHKVYANSVSYAQLYDGVFPNSTQIVPDCDPIIYNRDTPYRFAVDGTPLDPDAAAFPCGYVATTLFNDTYTITNTDTNTTIPIIDSGISYWSDSPKYRNVNLSAQWTDVQKERFAVWMQLSLFNRFQKAWGIIDVNLAQGNYKISIQNNWNSAIFGGTKSIVITQLGPIANASEFLAYAYLSMGALSFVLAITFSFRGLRKPKGIVDAQTSRSLG
jgi:hypothetical protein